LQRIIWSAGPHCPPIFNGKALITKEIYKIAICSGGGANYAFLGEAIEKGADLYLTGDSTEMYHLAKDVGINAIFAGHHATDTSEQRRQHRAASDGEFWGQGIGDSERDQSGRGQEHQGRQVLRLENRQRRQRGEALPGCIGLHLGQRLGDSGIERQHNLENEYHQRCHGEVQGDGQEGERRRRDRPPVSQQGDVHRVFRCHRANLVGGATQVGPVHEHSGSPVKQLAARLVAKRLPRPLGVDTPVQADLEPADYGVQGGQGAPVQLGHGESQGGAQRRGVCFENGGRPLGENADHQLLLRGVGRLLYFQIRLPGKRLPFF